MQHQPDITETNVHDIPTDPPSPQPPGGEHSNCGCERKFKNRRNMQPSEWDASGQETPSMVQYPESLEPKSDTQVEQKTTQPTETCDHTEVIDIEYDPEVISYSQLLNLFWNNHEYSLTKPIKRQYMSLILYHNDKQRIIAEKSRDSLQREKNEKFVTEISPFTKFYPAEDYHQKYRLQQHPWLLENIGLKNSEQLQTWPLAAKLNGYLAGATTPDEFERHVPSLGLSEKAVQYVREYVIERHGNGLYC